jgi:hypothetical protein
MSPEMERIGVSGHQALSGWTREAVRQELSKLLAAHSRAVGVTSLAVGSDQIFAEAALADGYQLDVILPCADYEATFDEQGLATFKRLLACANRVKALDFATPSQEAFFAAGKAVVDDSDILLAIWDGAPAAGLGGTADVVRYANSRGKKVTVIWPEGASRG